MNAALRQIDRDRVPEIAGGLWVFPVLHGSAPFSACLRKVCWQREFSRFCLAFPALLRDEFIRGVEGLPVVGAVVLTGPTGTRAFATVDPCDAYVEAARQALQRRKPLHFLESSVRAPEPVAGEFPDPVLLDSIGLERYLDLCRSASSSVAFPERLRLRALEVVEAIEPMAGPVAGRDEAPGSPAPRPQQEPLLLVCDLPMFLLLESLPGSLYEKRKTLENMSKTEGTQGGSSRSGTGEPGGIGEPSGGEGAEVPGTGEAAWSGPVRAPSAFEDSAADPAEEALTVRLHSVPEKQLYFALGELPFYTAQQERERLDPLAPPAGTLHWLKKILTETRDRHLDAPLDSARSLGRLQVCMQFMRNLAARRGRLAPDLFEIVTAAKGVFGHGFAGKVLEAAKYYPWFDLDHDEPRLSIGTDRVQGPLDPEPVRALNLLGDAPRSWRTLHLKADPGRQRMRRYRYQWDPRGMCSHLPEDARIEGFNHSLRHKSREVARPAPVRSHKFTASIMDGLDVRETLRNWHTGEIYVREEPPACRPPDTVVILFDSEHDQRYPHRATWYAEHTQESTLTFYATNPFEHMVGPGIGRAEYGGLSLVYPPRPIPNVFEAYPAKRFSCLAEQLVFGALLHSAERDVACASLNPPGQRLRRLAASLKKRLIWIPLSHFSAETLRKLRCLHVLGGKEVRSWAGRFIED